MTNLLSKNHPLLDLQLLMLISFLERAGNTGCSTTELMTGLKSFAGDGTVVRKIYYLRSIQFVDASLVFEDGKDIKKYKLSTKGQTFSRHLSLQHLFRELERFELELKEVEILKQMEKQETVVQ